MRSRRSLFRFALALLALGVGSFFSEGLGAGVIEGESPPELVDRIVAIIDQEVITLSEAEEAQRIGGLRREEPLSLREVVDRLIERRLVEREVDRFSPEPVPQNQVDTALIDLRESFGSPGELEAALAENELSESEVEGELRRQLKVARYLEKRFRALTYVSDEEVERYFEEELLPALPEGMSVPARDDYDEEIRRILEERKFNDRVGRFLEEIAARASIRRYVW